MNKMILLTSGGDAPGMNAAIRAVVRCAMHAGVEVFGAYGGYEGIIKGDIQPMGVESVANTILRGGTILHTARFPEFKDAAVRAQAKQRLGELGIDGMVVIGGDGSFRGASMLQSEGGPKVVGIPCTIDNDIPNTEYSIGFDTARNTALEAIDRVRDTAFSLNRNFLVEVMGRASGFLAVDVGIAGGAEFILIPEIPTSIDKIIDRLTHRNRTKLASIIVVAEADDPGRSIQIAEQIKQQSGIIYKVCILGHTQRGGSPTVKDRKVASLMGAKAVDLLLQGKSNQMIAMRGDDLMAVPFPDPGQPARRFSNAELLKTNEILCDM